MSHLEKLTTTGKVGTLEEEQPKVGPKGAMREGASESKDTERVNELKRIPLDRFVQSAAFGNRSC